MCYPPDRSRQAKKNSINYRPWIALRQSMLMEACNWWQANSKIWMPPSLSSHEFKKIIGDNVYPQEWHSALADWWVFLPLIHPNSLVWSPLDQWSPRFLEWQHKPLSYSNKEWTKMAQILNVSEEDFLHYNYFVNFCSEVDGWCLVNDTTQMANIQKDWVSKAWCTMYFWAKETPWLMKTLNASITGNLCHMIMNWQVIGQEPVHAWCSW